MSLVEAIRNAMVESYERFGPIDPDDYMRIRCPDCYGRRRECLLCHGTDSVIITKEYAKGRVRWVRCS